MNRPFARTVLFSTALLLALSGCVRFGTKPPKQLLSLSSVARVAPGTAQSSAGSRRLVVMTPDAPRALATVRVPVQVDATSVAYVKDAQWNEPPRFGFQRLLIETLSADGAYFVTDAGGASVANARLLSGDLVEFGIDARTQSAVVTFDATLSDPAGTGAEPRVLRQRFSASVPASKITADRVAAPLAAAANKVAVDVAAWTRAQ